MKAIKKWGMHLVTMKCIMKPKVSSWEIETMLKGTIIPNITKSVIPTRIAIV